MTEHNANSHLLFMQLAQDFENKILRHEYAKGQKIPSTKDLAVLYSMNAATIQKGLNVLARKNIIEKKRGIGFYVSDGALLSIYNERREQFNTTYVEPLVKEAILLGYSKEDIVALIEKHFESTS